MIAAAWIIFKSFIGRVIDLFTRYPLQFIIVLLCLYAYWQKLQLGDIQQEYTEYKTAAEQLAKDKEHENEILREYAINTVQDVMATHNESLTNEKLDRKRVEDKLKGSINEISNELNIYRDSIKLRNESTSSINVSSVAEHTSNSSQPSGNCNETLATVVDACKVTDYDYEALYNLYQKQCNIYGCE
jgi:hypothetical protein